MLDNILKRGEQSDEVQGGDSSATDGGVTIFDEEDTDLSELGEMSNLAGSEEDMLDGFADDSEAISQELEQRVDELENEIAGISSTVNTVKRENEEISGTMNDIEENVRSLLDIYEMVTRGVNPFVDSDPGHGGGAGQSFGIFDARDDDPEPQDELDESVAEADAESFFEDDLDDDFESGEDGSTTSVETSNAEGSGTATSFDELKSEYEDGEAEWADDDGSADTEPGELRPSPVADVERSSSNDRSSKTIVSDEEPPDHDIDDSFDFGSNHGSDGKEEIDNPSGANEYVSPDQAESSMDDPRESITNSSDLQFVEDTLAGTADSTAKPYLTRLPNGYVGDLLVMEWLEYLVSASGPNEAHRALTYYNSIEWIDDQCTDHLCRFLTGFGTDELLDEEMIQPPSELTIRHHAESLHYICRLKNDPSTLFMLNEDSIPVDNGQYEELPDRGRR